MRLAAFTFAALLPLAGCNLFDAPKQEGGDMSAEEVAEQLADMKIQPGQWEATNEIISASAPGVPEEALAQMVGQKTTVSNCITPEQAAQPNANFLAVQKTSDCTYQDWSMQDGRMTGTMTCTGGQLPGTMVMKMDGTYSDEAYDMTMDMETGGLPGGVTMTVKARTSGERVGECVG
ncbi:DUF3617 domain-containing protein [Sphingosinicella humi]|uniref:DUF3617 domain-containing protein n=1 Tax=Allosphingosinicella humi TaxID=2068657 RepID=A0A2U2J3D2_9SPHN|nr:DUF3617 domain-containing protein [Sphingosinicella humi]PWG02853.1 hypothetical protein DF286_08205 [Sphingosinicella humi]